MNEPVVVTVDLAIYSPSALMKAAYKFTDRYFIKIEQGTVCFTPKNKVEANLEGLFFNELLDQGLREKISIETAPVRNLIMAYALSQLEPHDDHP